jgi:hypothetical protein
MNYEQHQKRTQQNITIPKAQTLRKPPTVPPLKKFKKFILFL